MNNIRSLTKRAVAAVTTGTPKGQIEAIRSRRLELQEQRKVIDGARKPLEEAEARLGVLLDHIAGGLDCDLSDLADHRTDRLPELLRPSSDIGNRLNDRFLLALLISTNRSAVRDVLAATLRKSYDHLDVLSSEERSRRLEEIEGELLQLENREEMLIRQSEIDGSPLLRRDDADPAVVLASTLAA